MYELLKNRFYAKQPVEEIKTDWQGQTLARERGRRRRRRSASMVESMVDRLEDNMVGSFGENGSSNEMEGPGGN